VGRGGGAGGGRCRRGRRITDRQAEPQNKKKDSCSSGVFYINSNTTKVRWSEGKKKGERGRNKKVPFVLPENPLRLERKKSAKD